MTVQVQKHPSQMRLFPSTKRPCKDDKSARTPFTEFLTKIPRGKKFAEARKATKLVLRAHQYGLLRWTQLAAILEHQVEYIRLYRTTVTAVAYLADRLVNADGSERDPTPGEIRVLESKYLNRLVHLTELLQTGESPSQFHAEQKLEGKAIEYWTRGGHTSNESLDSPHDEVSRAYEKELSDNADFKNAAQQLAARIEIGSWCYSFHANRLVECGDGGSPSKELSKNVPEATLREIKEFCASWCLEKIGVERISVESERHITMRALRLRLMIRPDHTGFDVFIPRYYRFSHIKNYENKDFAELKKCMDEIFLGYRKASSRVPLKQLVAEAKEKKRSYEAWGLSKHDAWDQSRRDMAWTESTMRRHLAVQPKRRDKRAELAMLKKFLQEKRGMTEQQAANAIIRDHDPKVSLTIREF